MGLCERYEYDGKSGEVNFGPQALALSLSLRKEARGEKGWSEAEASLRESTPFEGGSWKQKRGAATRF